MVRTGMRLAELLAGVEYLMGEKFSGRVTYWVETRPGEASEMRRSLAEHFDPSANGHPSLDQKREAERLESFRMRMTKWCDRPTSPLKILFRAGRISSMELVFLLFLLLAPAQAIFRHPAPSRARKLEAAVNIMEVIGHQTVRISMLEEQLQRLQQQNHSLAEENKRLAAQNDGLEKIPIAPKDEPVPTADPSS